MFQSNTTIFYYFILTYRPQILVLGPSSRHF